MRNDLHKMRPMTSKKITGGARAARDGSGYFGERGGDGLVRARVARPDRALRFDLDVVFERLGGLFEPFGGHDGVGETGRAGSDGNDFGDVW
jgi:hypothetical protein